MNQLLDGCPTADTIRRMIRERREAEPEGQTARVVILDSAVSLYLWEMLCDLYPRIVILEVGAVRLSEHSSGVRLTGGYASGSSSHELPARELSEEMLTMDALTDRMEGGGSRHYRAVPLVLSADHFDLAPMLRNDFSDVLLHHQLNWHPSSARYGQSAGKRARNRSRK
jgi:hypothetical protein